MSDFKFACPQCQQHIACGPEYFGHQISCPACGAQMQVPNPSPPAPPSSPLIPRPPAPPQAGAACPSCAAPIAPGAVICTACGYNVQTKQRVQPQSAPAPKGVSGAARAAAARAAGGPKKVGFFQTPTPYVLIYVILLGVAYFFLREPFGSVGALRLVIAIYGFSVHIYQAVDAFMNHGVGMGFMTLCIPCFSLYYVFYKSENDTLKILMSISILGGMGSRFLRHAE